MGFNDEISTLFDNANNIRSYIIENKSIILEEEKTIDGMGIFDRINLIISLRPNVLLCGAINRRDHSFLINNGINVINNLSGNKDIIIKEFIVNFIENDVIIDKQNNHRRFRGGRR
ncbi:hypothetical protein J7L48_08535 [bacterium]|nr:hypothetical protein [bacterium]